MTDIYISYAREDRERVRPLAESLQFEGWDVWWDPSEPTLTGSAAIDQKLDSAGAILVVWSGYARGSEYVRSEAATGLYKNKLIQTRVDNSMPPRPFDQVEVVDLSHWNGSRDDASWRQCLANLRLYAGAPQMAESPQPFPTQAQRKIRLPKAPKVQGSNSYLERERSIAIGPVAVVALAIAAGASVWFLDPFGIRGGAKPAAATEAKIEVEPEVKLAAAPATFEDSPESEADWSSVDRRDVAGLRDYVGQYPRTSTAETARSMLRVMDAQAWVEAVTIDNEKAYTTYLARFPVDGVAPGAMAVSAQDRLTSLGVERKQAIEEIQRGLAALEVYSGPVDGKGGTSTTNAVKRFAAGRKGKVPSLTTSAPRDLRTYADLIQRAVDDAGGTTAIAVSEPIIATARVPTAPTVAPTPKASAPTPAPSTAATTPATTPTTTTAATNAKRAAEAADLQRRAEAEALVAKAQDSAEGLAAGELKRASDINAWIAADKAGTIAAYQAYLASHPAGFRVSEARAELAKLNRPAAFSLDTLSGDVRAAAEAGRKAQTTATARAAAARATAEAAQSASGLRTIASAGGDRFETQIANGAPNGLGIRVAGDGKSSGNRYRGEIRNGVSSGLGVQEFGENSGNAQALARYEGEHGGDDAVGYGVTYWKNGNSFAGIQGGGGVARGVLTLGNGQRYEGEVRNGIREGYGVVWSNDGQVVMGGRWQGGQLVSPMATQIPALAPASTPAPTAAVGPAQAPAPGTTAPISLVPKG